MEKKKENQEKQPIKEIKIKESKVEKTLKVSSEEILAQAIQTWLKK